MTAINRDEVDVAALAALETAATPGPWEHHQSMHAEPYVCEQGRGQFGVVATPGHGRADYGRADAEFIAAARNALPDLLAEVTRLRAQVGKAWDEGFGAGLFAPANRALGLGDPVNPYRAALSGDPS